jgi:hypothetical protein
MKCKSNLVDQRKQKLSNWLLASSVQGRSIVVVVVVVVVDGRFGFLSPFWRARAVAAALLLDAPDNTVAYW